MSISVRNASRTVLFSTLTLAAAAPAALAQDGGSTTATTAADKKIQLSAGLTYGLPQGDFKKAAGMDVVGSSPGILLGGGYEVIPHLSVLGGIRYLAVASEIDGVKLSSWDLDVGARYAHPVAPLVSVYGEAYVQRVSYSLDAGGGAMDESGIGVEVGGGVLYRLKPNLSLGGGLGYSATSLKPEQGDSQSSGWLSVNAFAAYHL